MGEKTGLLTPRLLSGAGYLAAEVEGAGAEHLLLFRNGEGPITVPEWELQTNAEAAALTRRQSRITGFFAAGGTSLEAAGQVLFDSPGAVDAGMVAFPGDALISVTAPEPTVCRIASPRQPVAVKRLEGTMADYGYDGLGRLLEIPLPAGEMNLSAVV